MKIFIFVVMICSFSFASTNLDDKLQRLSEFANHFMQVPAYNPFEEEKLVQENQTNKVFASQVTKSIVVKSIFNNRAYINNKWYSIGDAIDDFVVKSITHEGVIMQKNGKQEFFQLRNEKQNFFNLQKEIE